MKTPIDWMKHPESVRLKNPEIQALMMKKHLEESSPHLKKQGYLITQERTLPSGEKAILWAQTTTTKTTAIHFLNAWKEQWYSYLDLYPMEHWNALKHPDAHTPCDSDLEPDGTNVFYGHAIKRGKPVLVPYVDKVCSFKITLVHLDQL